MNFSPEELQVSLESDSRSFNSKEFAITGLDAIGSMDLVSEPNKANCSDFFEEIEKKEESDQSEIRFIKDVQVVGIKHEKKNLFSTRNLYTLETVPFGWKVDRRLSDFKWLCERMTREFPDIGVSFSNL